MARDERHEAYRDRHMGGRGMDSGFMGMIGEDHSAPANLPQGVVHKYYKECEYMDRYELDDSIRGIDEAINDSVRKLDDYASDSKY